MPGDGRQFPYSQGKSKVRETADTVRALGIAIAFSITVLLVASILAILWGTGVL